MKPGLKVVILRMIQNHNCIELPDLKRGDRRKEVKFYQILLNTYGFSCGTPDSIFGSKTESATIAFNKKFLGKNQSICDINTWLKILNL